ncbi:hypothetical protein OZX61_08280 [Acinetobacter sp. ESL0695]|uniref:hypothetical protein n=1 Tax=Acinetobacter sp. ESL0695 TaxID=2983215 RepID=UPI0023F5252B|nr:hypothetical protein [Acinetobacter sp. ESL0695]WEV48276.1 hypothetical protein OZX61_08280 [Acinetobacter sp. ESL0695]
MQKYQTFLTEHISKQTSSIESYIVDGIKVWLKKASIRHPWWIYLPLLWLSKFLNLQILTPVPNYGGRKSILCEMKRIRELHHIGISVPEILAETHDGVLIQDISYTDQGLMQLDEALGRQESLNDRIILLRKAIIEIKKIHAKESYLSEAFARNILVDSQFNISFIDFETDPGYFLDLQTCQARDWLCLIFSTAFRFNHNESEAIKNLLKTELASESKVIKQLSTVGIRFKWLNKIGIDKLGRDGKRMKSALDLLEALSH